MKDDSKPQNLLSSLVGGGAVPNRLAAGGIYPPSSPSIPPPPSGLEQFFSRPVANGLYFRGKLVHLDGYKFVGCRFDNCTLMVGTGNFELVNCIVDPSTTIQYGVQAMNVIRLFNAHNDWMHSNFPVFAPTRNPDGSITISGGM